MKKNTVLKRVNPEKAASPTSVHQRVLPEEGGWPPPSSDHHSPIITYNDYGDVTTIDQKHDSFEEPYRVIQPRNGARPIGDNRVGSPRPPRSTSYPKHSSPADNHQGDSKPEKAKQRLRNNGSYIKNFVKTVLLLIVVFYFISVSLRTPREEEVQYPQPQIPRRVTEVLIHYMQYDIPVLRLIFTLLLTIGKLGLYINSMISKMTDRLSIQSSTDDFDLFMRMIAILVLVMVEIIAYFVHAIAISIAHLIADLPFVDMNQIQ